MKSTETINWQPTRRPIQSTCNGPEQKAVCRSSKIIDERLAEESQADTVVARLFPTIGPRLGFGLGGEVGRFILENMLKVLRRQAIVVDGELPQRIALSMYPASCTGFCCWPASRERLVRCSIPDRRPPTQPKGPAEKIGKVADSPVEIRDLTDSNGNSRTLRFDGIPISPEFSS